MLLERALVMVDSMALTLTDGVTTWIGNGTTAAAQCLATYQATDMVYLTEPNADLCCRGILQCSVYLGYNFICLLTKDGHPIFPPFITYTQ
jgi:hypothetical protein